MRLLAVHTSGELGPMLSETPPGANEETKWLKRPPIEQIATVEHVPNKTGNNYQNVLPIISSLNAATTYHFRIVATNTAGTRHGTDRTFTTQ